MRGVQDLCLFLEVESFLVALDKRTFVFALVRLRVLRPHVLGIGVTNKTVSAPGLSAVHVVASWNQAAVRRPRARDCRKVSKTDAGRLDVLAVGVLPVPADAVGYSHCTSVGIRPHEVFLSVRSGRFFRGGVG